MVASSPIYDICLEHEQENMVAFSTNFLDTTYPFHGHGVAATNRFWVGTIKQYVQIIYLLVNI